MALVGPNGAGKSTLLELLPRFRHPSNGHIVIDGQDIADVSLESLRSKIGFVTQDTPLFDGTITENVTYGVRDASEEQIQRAARLAGVDELVASLPDGWETKVREGRRMLSRGQRQRVVLARALAADPSIILLDEVGSGLDIETQRTLSEGCVCWPAQDGDRRYPQHAHYAYGRPGLQAGSRPHRRGGPRFHAHTPRGHVSVVFDGLLPDQVYPMR